tara:strand:- start:2610 stop:2945 length:336 start_codon:yes stop_codon:yes gene_type:complete
MINGKELVSNLKGKDIITIGISSSGNCDATISYKAAINDFLTLKNIYKDLKTKFEDIYTGLNTWEYSFDKKGISHKLEMNKLNISSFEFLIWKIAIASKKNLYKQDYLLCF